MFLGCFSPLVYDILAPHCFDYCSSVNFEIRRYETLDFVLFFQIVLDIQNPLRFHLNFRVIFLFLPKTLILVLCLSLIKHISLNNADCIKLIRLQPFHVAVLRVLRRVLYFHVQLNRARMLARKKKVENLKGSPVSQKFVKRM